MGTISKNNKIRQNLAAHSIAKRDADILYMGLQDLAETLEEELGEFLLNLGIDHLHSTIETIVSKTNRKPSH